MVRARITAALVAVALLAAAHPGPATAAAGPVADPAAFVSPPQTVRPKTRWWWATPYSAQQFADEVDAFAGAGFGGAEVAFNVDGWGTAEQRQMLATSLTRAQRDGIRLDMTLGASWPVTTPNTKPGSGLSEQELQYGRATVDGGATFSGAAPPPFDDASNAKGAKLIAVTAARITSDGPAVATPGTPPATSTVLDPNSLVDLTPFVSAGRLTWDAPNGGRWVVFGFWQRDAAEGVMDHLSRASVNAVTQYLDANQIGSENGSLLPAAAHQFFEDSLELDTQELFWTDRFAQEFKARRGYDAAKYLPLFFVQGETRFWVPDKIPVPDFDLPAGEGDRLRHDYYETLTDLYVEHHLAGFAEWANTHAMQYRTQAGFGNSFDAIRSAREVARRGGIADDESLNAGDPAPFDEQSPAVSPAAKKTPSDWRFALDHYRTVAGGAHQGGQTEVSSELGAVFFEEHMTGLEDLKRLMDKEWAAGITRPIVHGYAYQSPGSPWPGRPQFSNVVGTSWNAKTFPQWSLFKPLTDYWARGAMVLEQGKPRTDVAVYRDGFVTTQANVPFPLILSIFTGQAKFPLELEHQTPFFDGAPLERAGYTLEYLDPVGLREPQAAGHGVLYPDGPAYRALIVDERALPGATADAIAREAASGLAVVFVGGLPDRGTGHADTTAEDAQVRAAVARTLAAPKVRSVAAQADAAGALAAMGVEPAARWDRPAPVYSQHREVDGTDYWYLWNAGNDSVTFTPSFATTGTPRRLDLWTGKIARLANYHAAAGRTSVPVTLRSGENLVLAFTHDAPEAVHAVASTAEDVVATAHGLAVTDTRGGSKSVGLSDGRIVNVTLPPLPSPITPATWHLHIDEAGPDGTTPHDTELTTLADWADIPGLSLVSGTGTYTTTVTLPDGWTAAGRGTYLELGAVGGAMQAYVNGTRVAPNVTFDDRLDISALLTPGANEIKVVVATMLKSTMLKRARAGDPTAGLLGRMPYTEPYGLLGPVSLVPYARADVYASTSADTGIGGSVPATLALTVGPPASFGNFAPGVTRDYSAQTTANVTSTAGDATLTVSDPTNASPGHLVNGAYSLPSPLLARGSTLPSMIETWNAPISNDAVTIAFSQHIDSRDILRTGAYSKTLTFTLSTTTP